MIRTRACAGNSLVCLSTLPLGTAATATASPPINLLVEHSAHPLGIDAASPRLSWQLMSDERGAAQSAYQIRIAASAGALRDGRDLISDTGRVDSTDAILHPYGGPALSSRRRYYWQVRTWDQHGKDLGWSEPGWWEMGLLAPTEWSASWISPAKKQQGNLQAGLLDRELLQPIDLDRISDEQQRSDGAGLQGFKYGFVHRRENLEVEILAELARLLLRGHLRDESIRPRSHVLLMWRIGLRRAADDVIAASSSTMEISVRTVWMRS